MRKDRKGRTLQLGAQSIGKRVRPTVVCEGGIVVKFTFMDIIECNSYGHSYQEGSEPCKISMSMNGLLILCMVCLCDGLSNKCNEFAVYVNAFTIEWLSVKYITVKNKCDLF